MLASTKAEFVLKLDKVSDRMSDKVTEVKSEVKVVEAEVKKLQKSTEQMVTAIDVTRESAPSLTESMETTSEVDEVKVKQGIMFSSSIGLGVDKERLKEAALSEIKMVPTYHITSAKGPDLHLTNNIEKHMDGKKYDFAVLAVGTDDVTTLDTEDGNVLEACTEKARLLVAAANRLVTEYNTDVFITEMPPRYDSPDVDPAGSKAMFSKFINANLLTMTMSMERVNIVEQSSLARQGKTRDELFQEDGLHLRTKGVYNYTTNLITALHKAYQELRDLEVHKNRTQPVSKSDESSKVGGKYPICNKKVSESVKKVSYSDKKVSESEPGQSDGVGVAPDYKRPPPSYGRQQGHLQGGHQGGGHTQQNGRGHGQRYDNSGQGEKYWDSCDQYDGDGDYYPDHDQYGGGGQYEATPPSSLFPHYGNHDWSYGQPHHQYYDQWEGYYR